MAPLAADARRPLLLAIDTSTDHVGLALYDGEVVAELTWPASRTVRRVTVPEIIHLLALAGRAIGDVAAVGVALGPGSFSALRSGLSVAKGLAYAGRRSLIGIPTLDVVSYPHRQAGYPVWSVVQAGRGRVVGACYSPLDASHQAVAVAYHGAVAGLVARITGPAIVAGEVPHDMIEALAQTADVVVQPPSLRLRRPSVLAELAWQRWRAGQADDPFTLEPLYVHGDSGGDGAVLA